MTLPSRPALKDLALGVEGVLLTNVAWIRQAEQHNASSHNLPGARERTPVLHGSLFWLQKLTTLSDAAGGDEARVEAFIDRAIAQLRTAE